MHSRIFFRKISVLQMQRLCLLAAALLLTAVPNGLAQADGKKTAKDPARITDGLREETPNDFLRVTFVSAERTGPRWRGRGRSALLRRRQPFICRRCR